MCDIDHFKQVNDACGHAAGDEVLQQVVARIHRSIRSNSDWMARMGGEEFLIVLPETDHAGGVCTAEKIRRITVEAPFLTRAGKLLVTSSFGVASTEPQGPDLTLTMEALMKAGDECLYKSKQAGRNRTTAVEIPAALPLSASG